MTDPAIVKEYGITDANPFFKALLQRPYLERMVISPHIYGPSVSSRKDWYKVGGWSWWRVVPCGPGGEGGQGVS